MEQKLKDEIIERRTRTLDDLRSTNGLSENLLPKGEQVRQYRDRSQNTKWIEDALTADSNLSPQHKWLLKTIKTHGFKGLSDYVNAMEKMQKEAP
ncbi:MAG: hypothetical protein JW384_01718 [Nitrosomonadaceae bacterium]|nr:hypothetical protein [Nitrosomonadaceae bacterium]